MTSTTTNTETTTSGATGGPADARTGRAGEPAPPLRLAVPNKGALSDATVEMLREAGYRVRRDSKELVVTDAENDVEFFYLRPRDIAVYVGSGTVDAGVTGRDLLLDSGSPAVEVMTLGFGGSTFRYAGQPGRVATVADIDGKRVATSYPGLVRADLARAGVAADVVRLDGAVETAITLGVADVIADVVETGATLRSQGLEVFGEPILRSEAVLIRGDRPEATAAVEVLQRRLTGVITARTYVMLDYDCPRELVDRATELTPGLESPTVSPLQDDRWVAVRAMVPRAGRNRLMDELYDLGARAILVTDIAACRL
ncbi:ATP phosphoribosyltransferase [Terracoccus luteus]|uniref:ATP phosphoribosyltransferase n=1 Tax=Terracoccus luteus TaxID=53356 RepID=A0A495XZP2_9MICO|nr:ATP phosphoribosyltransferase [Terracoccus luteus]MBB2987811.1 ATP phosphoribosyltransferase [Terracoccus luteus]MCP2173462.1 ATP phosphoribosyltransferase [Terracoccus luteus]RKT78196.1 ATP phosphoribosyltransferase (homohexameric) [Terracoccus luteus]